VNIKHLKFLEYAFFMLPTYNAYLSNLEIELVIVAGLSNGLLIDILDRFVDFLLKLKKIGYLSNNIPRSE